MKSIIILEEMINSLPPEYLLIKKGLLSAVNKIEEDIKDNYVLREHSVTWGVLDFVSRAENAEGEGWKKVYDEEAFEDELISMISNHDASVGITWDTIDYYLENCKF